MFGNRTTTCRVDGCIRMAHGVTGHCRAHVIQIMQGGTPGGSGKGKGRIPHEVVVEADRRNRRNFESITSLAREYGCTAAGLRKALIRYREDD